MEVETVPSNMSRPGLKSRYSLSKSKSVLLLESDPGLRKVISISLNQLGVRVLPVPTFLQAQAVLSEKCPDLFVVSLENPESHYGDLIEQFRQKTAKLGSPVLLMTTRRPNDVWRDRYKPDVVIYKPFDIRFFIRRIKDLLHIEQAQDGQ